MSFPYMDYIEEETLTIYYIHIGHTFSYGLVLYGYEPKTTNSNDFLLDKNLVIK